MFFIFSENTSWANVETMPIAIFATKSEAKKAVRNTAESVLSLSEASQLAATSRLIADEMSALMMEFYKTPVIRV
jgi:hypothetical protein